MNWIDIVTLVGLAIALYQLWQVGSVARATHAALQDHAERVGDYSVLLLVPELKRIELACEREASGEDREKLSESMHQWVQIASEVKGFLSQHERASNDTLAELQAAVVAVSRAKGRVLMSEDDPLEITKTARSKMTAVATSMAQHSAALRVAVKPPSRPPTFPELGKLALRRLRGSNGH